MLHCRRGMNCSAAIVIVSLCRHLEPLVDLFPRLVLRACLLPSWCTTDSEKPLRPPGVYRWHLTAARISLRWVDEHSVPRAAVTSPTVGGHPGCVSSSHSCFQRCRQGEALKCPSFPVCEGFIPKYMLV